ncbi:MAG TPA: hypothetical protein VJV78_00945 [Polyangiales bacterium]|nr:hypothetical protein [Polyangiales bacterium]
MSKRVIGVLVSCCALIACEVAETDARPARLPKTELTPDALATAWSKAVLFASGTRLRARLYELGDGVQYFLGFEDELLGATCSFERAEDGEMRCMPNGGGTFRSEPLVQYADANCSDPVLAAWRGSGAQCLSSTLSITVAEWASCGSKTVRAYRVVQGTPPRPIYARSPDGCVQQPQPDCLFQLEHIEPSRFVRGEARSERADSELAVDWVDYADGASAVLGMRDTTRDLRCGSIDGLRDRCVPDEADVYATSYFADEGCATPAVVTSCADGGTGIALIPGSCRNAPKLFELGPPASGPGYFVENEGTCEMVPTTNLGVYELSAAFHPSALPLLRRAQAGSGRLRIDYYYGASGRPLSYDRSQRGIYDAVLGTSCEIRSFADGTFRCVPSDAQAHWSDGPYLDAGCTDAVVAVHRGGDECDVPASAVRLVELSVGTVAVRSLGSRVTPAPAEVFDLRDGACEPIARSDSSVDYYRLGAPLDLAEATFHVD